jgi:hypothetical protein
MKMLEVLEVTTLVAADKQEISLICVHREGLAEHRYL